MSIDRYREQEVGRGALRSTEAVVSEDVLVKVFTLGPEATLEAHSHPGETNVFHILRGTVTVIQDGEESEVSAPGIVLHKPGVAHGARNDTDETVVFSASLCPMPS